MKRPRRLLLAAVLLVAAGAGAYGLGVLLGPKPELHGTALQDPPLVGDLALRHVERGELTLSEVGDGLLLVFFGYTRCPDVCPLTLARLARAYEQLGEPEDLLVVMITVDPGHDTPDVVQRYAAGFHEDFVGLSGSAAQIADATRTFYIGFRQLPDGYFNHTDAVVLVDRRRRMRLVYGQDAVPRIGDDLVDILAQRGW